MILWPIGGRKSRKPRGRNHRCTMSVCVAGLRGRTGGKGRGPGGHGPCVSGAGTRTREGLSGGLQDHGVLAYI